MAVVLRIAFTLFDDILIKWAVYGLFGGLISGSSILRLVGIAIMIGAFVFILEIYKKTQVSDYLISKKPKMCNILRKVFNWLSIACIFLAVIMFIISMYRIFVSHTIDGYAADIAVGIYESIDMVYGCIVFAMIMYIVTPSEQIKIDMSEEK